jgi:hypothetical protein
MSDHKINFILSIFSLITTFALLIAINTHTDLSSLFYILGGNTAGADVIADGKFNTFFISSLGLTSFIIFITYLLIVRCITFLAKVLIIIADIFLIAMVFLVTQERVLHHFTSDTQVNEVLSTTSDASRVLMGTSDTTLLTIVLVYMVIMLIGVIRTYKSQDSIIPNKASAYD